MGIEHVNRILGNIFSNRLAMEALQRRTRIYVLQEIVVDENELIILSNGSKNRPGP